MKQKIPCFCDNSFFVEAPEEIDLDAQPAYIDEITDGTFMNFVCPGCGKVHKPEFPLILLWPSKKLRLEVFTELDRGAFYRRKKAPPDTETVIGYPEMAERIAILRADLEAAAVEALKYYLLLKADESYPDNELSIYWASCSSDCLEFHIRGIREGEDAVSRVPRQLYEKTCEDYQKSPNSELFKALRVRSYLSVQNTIRPEALK